MKRWLVIVLFLVISVIVYHQYPAPKLPTDRPIDKLLVKKSERKLYVLSQGEVLKTYKISLGFSPEGDKKVEGDGKTPEGFYKIHDKNPHSGYFLNLGISYPSAKDRKEAQELGKPVGGQIKIHGLKNGHGYIGKFHRFLDWTWGCIALTNEEMQELYDHVPIGTPIEIRK